MEVLYSLGRTCVVLDIAAMTQMSLSESGYERKTKRTRKREFLDEMNPVVPWAELCR